MRILDIARRECGIIKRHPVFWLAMVVFPLLTMVFFTSLMEEGQPEDMPIGVVDCDNSTTSRKLVRNLDAFQTSHVVARYADIGEARHAIQRNEIYAFLYIPHNMEGDLLAMRCPEISFYYSMHSLTAGSLLFRDLKTISTLGGAAVGKATMTAKGFTDEQIMAFLQPITIDLHPIENPWVNYNFYLSAVLVPGMVMLFVFLITPYSLGMELKKGTARELLARSDNNIFVVLTGKLLPHTLIFTAVMAVYLLYVFGTLHFPHSGGAWGLLLLALLIVVPSQAFGVFCFGVAPSMRMSMSICSLWAVLSFSIAGNAFPVMAMDAPLQSLAWLFPLRHYFQIYQASVFNGYALSGVEFNMLAMLLFCIAPLFVMRRIKNAFNTFVYMP
ncbi:MAG: ABC transporter permease [Prevotella sp.]|nr:ABC transporter permease [Prevotella sp.]